MGACLLVGWGTDGVRQESQRPGLTRMTGDPNRPGQLLRQQEIQRPERQRQPLQPETKGRAQEWARGSTAEHGFFFFLQRGCFLKNKASKNLLSCPSQIDRILLHLRKVTRNNEDANASPLTAGIEITGVGTTS